MSIGIIVQNDGEKIYKKYADTIIGLPYLRVGNVKNLDIIGAVGTEQIIIKWNDPDDLILDDCILASWGGTRLIRKEGGYPQNINDGILVVDNKTRGQYSEAGYTDSNIDADTVYYYKLFPYTTQGAYTISDKNEIKRLEISDKYDRVLENNSWENIIEAANNGLANVLWNVGDKKTLVVTTSNTLLAGTYDMIIADWDAYNLSDGTGKSNIVFTAQQCTPGVCNMQNKGDSTNLSYANNLWNTLFKGQLMSGFPTELKSGIKSVNTEQKLPGGSSISILSNQALFLPTVAEVIKNSTVSDGGTLLEYFNDHGAAANILGGSTGGMYWCRSGNSVSSYNNTYSYVISASGGYTTRYYDYHSTDVPHLRFSFCL